MFTQFSLALWLQMRGKITMIRTFIFIIIIDTYILVCLCFSEIGQNRPGFSRADIDRHDARHQKIDSCQVESLPNKLTNEKLIIRIGYWIVILLLNVLYDCSFVLISPFVTMSSLFRRCRLCMREHDFRA